MRCTNCGDEVNSDDSDSGLCDEVRAPIVGMKKGVQENVNGVV